MSGQSILVSERLQLATDTKVDLADSQGIQYICDTLWKMQTCAQRVIARFAFNGSFGTNRLYRIFDEYVAIKKVKLRRKLTMLRVGNTYNKPIQYMTFKSGLCGGNPLT